MSTRNTSPLNTGWRIQQSSDTQWCEPLGSVFITSVLAAVESPRSEAPCSAPTETHHQTRSHAIPRTTQRVPARTSKPGQKKNNPGALTAYRNTRFQVMGTSDATSAELINPTATSRSSITNAHNWSLLAVSTSSSPGSPTQWQDGICQLAREGEAWSLGTAQVLI